MVFNSYPFALFFAALFAAYWLFSRWPKAQNVLLLGASYYFYSRWDARFLALLILSTVMDFACGLWVVARGRAAATEDRRGDEHGPEPGHARLLQIFQLLRRERCTRCPGPRGPAGPEGVRSRSCCPIGISFYTFQSMSYVIDVYRREIRPTRNLVQFAAFVSFFPHLVAGPIMRPTTLLPQITAPRRFDLQQFYEGAYLIFWGLLKKVVVADNLAPIVNGLFCAMGDARRRLGAAGDLCVRLPDLRRLLRLHRHRPGRLQVPGLRAGAQLQPPLLRDQPAATSGLGGTSASRSGCGTISTSPWAAAAAARCGPTAT